MAVITQTSLQGSGSRASTVTVLSASDTLTFQKGQRQVLVLHNATAGPLTPNLVGDNATTVPVQGYGSLDVSAGYTCPSIAAGETVVIPLDSISAYLSGTVVTVTGGDAMEAQLLG